MLKFLILLITSNIILFACDANCVVCHPVLVKNGELDKNHKILGRCTNCHTAKENEQAHSECGADCWQCHSVDEVNKIDIPEHKALPRCIKCHVSLDKNLLKIEGQSESSFSTVSLKDSIEGL